MTQLSDLAVRLVWGPFSRLRSATKHLGFMFEDPFVLVIQNEAYSVDDDFGVLKHTIRDSYRQFYVAKASQRRQDCSGQHQPIDVVITRAFYLSLHNPIHQSIMRHILTGSLDHTHRLYKSNLVSSLFALIVTFVMKLLNIFSGIVLGGTPFAMNIQPFYDSLVWLAPNGPNVFCIVVGLNSLVIMGSHCFLIWILLIMFKILSMILIVCSWKSF